MGVRAPPAAKAHPSGVTQADTSHRKGSGERPGARQLADAPGEHHARPALAVERFR